MYLLGGGPANSYMVEFDNFVAVFEAPTSEARSLAVIEQIVKLAPNKPIRWLISSHPHFDHIGGIRTLPPHRRHHRHAPQERRLPEPATC